MFLLDTDHCIYILNNKPVRVAECASKIGEGDLSISSVTVAELMYGAYNSQYKDDNLAKIKIFCATINVLPFASSVVRVFGEVKSALNAAGQLQGSTATDGRAKRDFDIAIAATALAYDLTLVTHNIAHYAGVNGLTIDDWHK